MVWGALGGARPGLEEWTGMVGMKVAPLRTRRPLGRVLPALQAQNRGLEFSLPEQQNRLPLLCDFLPSTRQRADGRASRWVQVCPQLRIMKP